MFNVLYPLEILAFFFCFVNVFLYILCVFSFYATFLIFIFTFNVLYLLGILAFFLFDAWHIHVGDVRFINHLNFRNSLPSIGGAIYSATRIYLALFLIFGLPIFGGGGGSCQIFLERVFLVRVFPWGQNFCKKHLWH